MMENENTIAVMDRASNQATAEAGSKSSLISSATDTAEATSTENLAASSASSTAKTLDQSTDHTISPAEHVDLNVMETLKFDTFHPFPRLPAELRLKIWKIVIEAPRVVKFSIVRGCRFPRPTYAHRRDQFVLHTIDRSAPSVLHINIESRVEARNLVEDWCIDFHGINNELDKDESPLRFFRNDTDIAHVQCGLSWGFDRSPSTYQDSTPPVDLSWALRRLREAKKVAISYDLVTEVEWTNSSVIRRLLIHFRARNVLIFLIKDRTSEYVRIGREWRKLEMMGMEWEENMKMPKSGEFIEIEYNKEFAAHVAKKVEKQRAWADPEYEIMRLEVKVLCEL